MTVLERESDDVDAVFDALSDKRRRTVIHVLAERRQPMSLTDLAVDVAARERDASNGDVPTEAVEAVRTSLYHVHLPKLADVGIVEYELERRTVEIAAEDSDAVNRFADADVVPAMRSNS